MSDPLNPVICDKPPCLNKSHITLTCRNHPNLRWYTKNIEHIGARTLFYKTEEVRECPCSMAALYHICE